MITLENNVSSKQWRHIIVYKDTFVNMTIGNFTNKRHAKRAFNFLKWYEKNHNKFADFEEAATRLNWVINTLPFEVNYVGL